MSLAQLQQKKSVWQKLKGLFVTPEIKFNFFTLAINLKILQKMKDKMLQSLHKIFKGKVVMREEKLSEYLLQKFSDNEIKICLNLLQKDKLIFRTREQGIVFIWLEQAQQQSAQFQIEKQQIIIG